MGAIVDITLTAFVASIYGFRNLPRVDNIFFERDYKPVFCQKREIKWYTVLSECMRTFNEMR